MFLTWYMPAYLRAPMVKMCLKSKSLIDNVVYFWIVYLS